MNDKWIVSAPWTKEQGPVNISPGSLIRNNFTILYYPSESEMTTSLHWTDLSRQEVANLRNLVNAEELRKLVYSSGYGLSWGTKIDMVSVDDPKNAAFDLMIDSKGYIPQAFLAELVSFIKGHKVQ